MFTIGYSELMGSVRRPHRGLVCFLFLLFYSSVAYYCVYVVVCAHKGLVSCTAMPAWSCIWLRTNGVNTHGAAAKVMNSDTLGKKVRPGTFGKIKVG